MERIRIVGWFVVLLTGAALTTAIIVRQVLLDRLDQRVEAGLVQEVEEMRQLVGGNDPETGRPFGDDVEAIFDTFIRRNLPTDHEGLFAIVDGKPFLASYQAPYRLDTEAELVARWAELTETTRDEVDTPVGPARWIALPVRSSGETLGVFVVANFVGQERDEVTDVMQVMLVTSAVVVAASSVIAWIIAGRVLAPVRQLTNTARSITATTQLDRRIETSGSGELAQLAATFNDMVERLQRAYRSQGAFVNDASHELRTPITIVRGHLQLLDDDPEERAATMRLVMDELSRMTRIVDDLLLLARSEHPGFLRLGKVDVTSLVDELVVNASTLGPRRWVIDARTDTQITADIDRLKQAMVNLVTNAVNHTHDDDEIGIGAEVSDGDLRLWVRDTGPGLDPGDESRIFDRFARGTKSAASGRGSGLGLAITRAIIEAHDGRIDVDNRPGQGVTFTIVLPTESPT